MQLYLFFPNREFKDGNLNLSLPTTTTVAVIQVPIDLASKGLTNGHDKPRGRYGAH